MKKVDTNTVVAVAALVTSVVAVFIAWDEGRLQRQSQRATFLPLIEIEAGVQTAGEQLSTSVSLNNQGSGVAYVRSFEIFIDGEDVSGWDVFADRLLGPELAKTADFSWDIPVGYFQPGDQKTIIDLAWNRSEFEAFRHQFLSGEDSAAGSFEVEVCFCSVFGECWTKTLTGPLEPQEVRACKAAADGSVMERIVMSYLARPKEAAADGR